MTYTISHSKGGSKKSTTAWHLANGFRKKYPNKKVIIIDTDMQQTITIVNNIRKGAELDYFDIYQPKSVDDLLKILALHKDDIVIIDTGGFDKDINRVAIKRADKVIVPLMASIHDVLGFSMFNSILDDVGVKHIEVLVTMVHHRQKDFSEIRDAISSFPSAKILKSKIPNNSANYKTMALGLSVYDIDHILCENYDGVINELC